MGWRYEVIILGSMTLLVFFLRYFVFRFYESPKFLISKGKEQEAIDVLHKIARFNKAPPPTLTIQHFIELDQAASRVSGGTGTGTEPVNKATAKHVVGNFLKGLKHLKGLFLNRLQLIIFLLLAVAYMVSQLAPSPSYPQTDDCPGRATTGPLT